jgi:hypothetical protein
LGRNLIEFFTNNSYAFDKYRGSLLKSYNPIGLSSGSHFDVEVVIDQARLDDILIVFHI